MMQRVGRGLSLALLTLGLFWVLTIRVATGIWIGSFTLNAYLTGVAALLAGLLSLLTVVLLVRKRLPVDKAFKDLPNSLKVVSLSGLPLLAYSLISLAMNFRIEGLQNTLVWAIFALTIFALPYWITPEDSRRAHSILSIVVVTVPVTKIIIFYSGVDFYGRASYAIVAVVLLAFAVSQRPQAWVGYLTPWLLLYSVLLCNVRSASVIAALLMIVSVWQWPLPSLARTTLSFAVAAVSGAMVFLFVGDRLSASGDAGLAQFLGEDNILAGIATTNRGAAWAYILENLPEKTNWWGQGAGHSSFLADQLLGIHHPHNEYLRIFFDLGWVGLTVFLLGSLAMLVSSFMNWRKTRTGLALTSVIAIVVVALMAVTDNPIVYAYIMSPVAILVATGLVARENDVSVTGNSSRGGE
jgi:O-antigen ligase